MISRVLPEWMYLNEEKRNDEKRYNRKRPPYAIEGKRNRKVAKTSPSKIPVARKIAKRIPTRKRLAKSITITKEITSEVTVRFSANTIRKNMAIKVRHIIENELDAELDSELDSDSTLATTDFIRDVDSFMDKSIGKDDTLWRQEYGQIYRQHFRKRCKDGFYSLLQVTRDTSEFQHDVPGGYSAHSLDEILEGKRYNYYLANLLKKDLSK